MSIFVYPSTSPIIVRICRQHLIPSIIIQSFNIVIIELIVRLRSTISSNPIDELYPQFKEAHSPNEDDLEEDEDALDKEKP